MDQESFQKKLSELVAEIGTLPASERAKLEEMAKDTNNKREEIRATVANLQESLDQLRLAIKYLLFDLEATKRENENLRRLLEEESES
jgi:septal ring factor EnvC (AmiA/AmiB activator)